MPKIIIYFDTYYQIKDSHICLFFVDNEFFRYLKVCHSGTIVGQNEIVGFQIRDLVIIFSIVIGLASVLYSENILIFQLCMGKEERFRFNMTTFEPLSQDGPEINLKWFHPYRGMTIMANILFAFLIPILYFKIYQFRRRQSKSIRGIQIKKCQSNVRSFRNFWG